MLVQQRGEPGSVEVERLAPLDPVKLDRPELIAAFLVVTNQAGLTA